MAKDTPPKSDASNVVFGNALPPKEAKAKKLAELGNEHNYAMSELVSTPFSKTAQVTSDVNTIYTNPMWFSPLHTPQSWQTASKRREVYQWSFINDPKIAVCDVSLYGDVYTQDIECIYKTVTSETLSNEEKEVFVQTGSGKKGYVDKATKRYVKKKACLIKARGVYEPIAVTHDHKCIVIRNEDVKCRYHKKKNCTPNCNSYTCQRAKCFASKDKDYVISKCNADEVRKGDYFLVPFTTDVEPSIITNIDQARFAGHLASDGWVRFNQEKSGYNCAICMNVNEREFVLPTYDKFLEGFGVDPNSMKESLSDSGNLITKRTATIRVADYAHQLVLGKGTTKRYTKEVMLLDPKLQLEVLGAYLQSDGSYDEDGNTAEITTYSKDLAYQLLAISYRCGILAAGNKQPISRSKGTFKTKSEFRYIVSFPSSQIKKIFPFCPGKISSSKNKSSQAKRFFWKNYVVTPVTSAKTFDYEGDVYDIRVPGEYTLTANGISIFQCRFFYECFTADNKVLMADGTEKYINQVKIDDLVISGDGSPRKVLNVFKRSLKDDDTVLDIVTQNVKIRCTANHEIPRVNSNGEVIWDSAETLKPGDKLLGPVENEFFEILYIQKVENVSEIDFVYDLEIDQIHSYFIGKCKVHNSEPKVAAGIDFYSQFPVNGFKLVWPHSVGQKKLLHFYEEEVKRLNLMNILKQISSEYFMLGDVFIHRDISCPRCFGAHINPVTGEVCNHAGGTISRIKILNPDWVEVTDTIFADEPKIMMIPDEQIVRICTTRQPLDIYNRLPDRLKQLVLARKPIPLSNRVVSHLKHQPSPYAVYGTSLIRRLFTTLAYKTKIMTANWIVAERLIIPIRVVKIGSDNRPATSADIAEVNQMLAAAANDPNLTLCTHHNFEFDFVGACYDEETEVLTREGFKKYGEFAQDEEILTYNVYTKEFEYQKPQQYQEYDYNNNLIHFVSDQFDIKVTPNHRMLGYYDNKQTMVEARDVVNELQMYYLTDEDGKWNMNLGKVNEILYEYYSGKVWCFTVSNGFFVTRRNGKVTLQGNSGKILQLGQELEHIDKELLDGLMLNQALLNGEMSGYQSAQVGVEVLIRRVEAWRNTLSAWGEEDVFKPIAQMKGFIDKESSEEYGQKVWLYPKIKWNDLNLKDKTSWYQLLMQLHDKQVISTQTLCEELDLQYDQEIERLRYEIAKAGPMGAQLGGGMGGMGGGLGGGLGGGGGGGGISAPGGGAAAPGGMGGDMGGMGGAPGGDMGGGGGGGAPGGGGVTAAGQPMKILKRSKAKALAEREEPMQYGQVRFTGIEQDFRKMLDNIYGSLNLNMPYYFQYHVQNPEGGHDYMIDFAFPKIKLGCEIDGKIFHSNPENVKHDRERDYNLAMRGWTILRFDDKTIDNKPEAVQQTVVGYLRKLSESKGTKKKASLKEMDGEAIYMTVYADKMIDVYNDVLPQDLIDILEEK